MSSGPPLPSTSAPPDGVIEIMVRVQAIGIAAKESSPECMAGSTGDYSERWVY